MSNIKALFTKWFDSDEDLINLQTNHRQTGGEIFSDIVFFVVVTALVALVFNPVLFTGGDNAYYISLSHSIMKDHTYRARFLTDQHIETTIPPGFPILLIFVQVLFGDSLLAMKLFCLLSFIIALYFAHLIFLQFGLKRYLTYPIVLFMALHPLINEYSRYTLTEAPFMAFSFAGFYFLERYIRSEKDWKGMILPGFLLAFSVLIRIPAAAILPAAFFYIWLRKGLKKSLTFTAVATVVLLPWIIWMFAAPGGDSFFYLNNFTKENTQLADSGDMTTSTLLSRIPKNHSKYLFTHFPHMLFAQIAYRETPQWLEVTVGAIAGLLILIGLLHALKQRQYFILFYLLIYGVILTFNHTARLRYLITILPFIYLLFFFAFREIFSLFGKPRVAKSAMLTLVTLLTVFAILQYRQDVSINLKVLNHYSMGDKYAGLHPVWKNYIQAAQWIRDNTDDDALVCARKPRISYLISGRKSRNFIYHDDPAKVVEDILANDLDYIIVDRIRAETPTYLVPALNSRNDLFEIKYKTDEPETYVIKVLEPTLSQDSLSN